MSHMIDYATLLDRGPATLNSSYFSSGYCTWRQIGKLVVVTLTDAILSTAPPNSAWSVAAISGLPAVSSVTGNVKWNIINFNQGSNLHVLRLATNTGDTSFYFHYTSGAGASADFNGQFIYLTD